MTKKKFCLSLHHNGANNYLIVNGTEVYKFNTKDFQVVAAPLCLGNISKDCSVDNMKKTELYDCVYDFGVDYDASDVDDISNIHKYLMEKMTQRNTMFGFVKKAFFTGLALLSILTSVYSLSCISINNQESEVRLQIVNVNKNKSAFFTFSIKPSKCSGSYNNINDPHAKMCVPDVIKNLNVKVFKLMSRTNEKRYIEGHETC